VDGTSGSYPARGLPPTGTGYRGRGRVPAGVRRDVRREARSEETTVDDAEVLARIKQLVDDEHRLESEHTGDRISEEDAIRLDGLRVALDQCWDLLRQRRARRASGMDADDAEVRPMGVVEHYKQ
jgi:hypothetical protein